MKRVEAIDKIHCWDHLEPSRGTATPTTFELVGHGHLVTASAVR